MNGTWMTHRESRSQEEVAMKVGYKEETSSVLNCSRRKQNTGTGNVWECWTTMKSGTREP